MLNCGDEIAQLNGWDYKNDPDRVEDSRNLHRSKFNWENAKQRTRKGTLQNALWQGMEELRKMRADECFSPDAWVTTWDSHNPGVLALVRKRGEETLVGLFNFTEYPAGASLDALGGKYTTADGKTVWLADVELQPYQALLVKKSIRWFLRTPRYLPREGKMPGCFSFSDAIAQTASSGCSSRVWVVPQQAFCKSKMSSCIYSCPACAYSVKGFNLRNFRLRELLFRYSKFQNQVHHSCRQFQRKL